MSGLTVLSANTTLEKTLVDFYGRSMSVRRVWSDRWNSPAEAAIETCADDPELVVIGSDLHQDQVLAIVDELHRGFPTTTVVCLVAERDASYAMKLLRQGARDVIIEKPASPEFQAELDPVVRIARSRSDSAGGADQGPRRVVAVISPKGGTGKTTVSANLATALARRRPTEVILLDLDIQFGDCAPALGMTPENNLVGAIDGLSHRPSTLKARVDHHQSGLAVLAPTDDLVTAEQIEPDQIEQVLVAAAKEFPLVVIDTASGIDAASLAAIEQATDLLVVATPDDPSVRAARRQLDTLDQLGYTAQHRTLVLNRSNAKGGLPVADVEAAIGLPVGFQIPNTRLITQSTNEGIPVVERGGSSAARRRMEELATHFVPVPAGAGGRRRATGRRRKS